MTRSTTSDTKELKSNVGGLCLSTLDPTTDVIGLGACKKTAEYDGKLGKV